jgi:hypothetical protein
VYALHKPLYFAVPSKTSSLRVIILLTGNLQVIPYTSIHINPYLQNTNLCFKQLCYYFHTDSCRDIQFGGKHYVAVLEVITNFTKHVIFFYLTLIYVHRVNFTDTLCNDIALTHNITTLINNVCVLLHAWNGTILLSRLATPPFNRSYSADRFNSGIFPNVRWKEVMLTAGPSTSSVACNVSGKYNARYWSGLVRLARRVGDFFLHHHVQYGNGFNQMDLNSV